MQDVIRQLDSGVYSIALLPGDLYILRHLLDPEVPYVWIDGYRPGGTPPWWTAVVPMSQGGPAEARLIRGLSYDLQMPTGKFLDSLDELVQTGQGLDLCQVTRSVPGSLGMRRRNRKGEWDWLPDAVLIQNGIVSSFYVPSPGDVATFWTVERRAIERALEFDDVRDAVRRLHEA